MGAGKKLTLTHYLLYHALFQVFHIGYYINLQYKDIYKNILFSTSIKEDNMLLVYHWNSELRPMLSPLHLFLVKAMYTQTEMCMHTKVNMHPLAIIGRD